MKHTFSVGLSNPELRKILETGVIKEHQGLRCVPKRIVEGPQGSEIIFNAVDPQSLRVSKCKIYFRSLRAVSLTATASPVLIVGLWFLSLGYSIHWAVGVAAALGVVCLQIATNVLNDVEDYLRLIDLPGGHGGSGVLQQGWVSVRDLRQFAALMIFCGGALSLPVLLSVPVLGFVFLALGILGALSYSSRPGFLKYRALGDLSVFLCCGPALTAGASLAFLERLDFSAVILGFYFGFLACAILHANNMQDIESDKARGSLTLAGLMGFRRSRDLLVAFYVLSYISVALLWGLYKADRPLSWLPLAVLLIPGYATYQMLASAYRAWGTASPLLNLIRIRAAQLHLAHGVALAVAFGLSKILEGSL